MEYNDLMKQAEEHNKKLHRTKDINICDLLSHSERYAISKIISERVFEEYGDMYEFKWQMSATGYFVC